MFPSETQSGAGISPWLQSYGERIYSDAQLREQGDVPPPEWLVEGLLPYGVFLLFADPGVGKSMLMQQLVHHLCYGRPLGDWTPPPAGTHRAWMIDLEGDPDLNKERSYAVTPFGELEQDGRKDDRTDHYILYTDQVITPAACAEYYETFRTQADAHLAWIEHGLKTEVEAGTPFTVMVVDTGAKFCGPRPKGMTSYDWEAPTYGRLNRLGQKYQVAIIVIHHTNKLGEISGSTGLQASATVTAKLELVDEDMSAERVGVLRSTKVRSGAPFRYPVRQNPYDGTWTFDADLTAAQAGTIGQKRDVLDQLAKQPRSTAELGELLPGLKNIRAVLSKLNRSKVIRSRFGRWEITAEHGRQVPGVPVEARGEPVEAAEPETEPDEQTVNGYRMLEASIAASRKHPVRFIPREKRDQLPWTLIDEDMTGAHRWERPDWQPADTDLVAVLDTNGAFFAACNDVRVCANLMAHTGELERYDPERAGLYQIRAFDWCNPNIGHPLGRIAEKDSARWWISTPHMAWLDRLAADGYIDPPVIYDSWTGLAVRNLFRDFSDKVRDLRNTLEGDAYTAMKVTASQALRSLMPKENRSPFWRPDWSVSVRAEASLRHWAKAYKAVVAGETLLCLRAVDEAVYLAPPDADSNWAPEGYRLNGRAYGTAKHKEVTVGDLKIPSPLAYGTWKSSRRGRR